MRILILLVLIFSFDFSLAGPTDLASFNTCQGDTTRNDLDNMCPRIEGANLPNCCPQLFKLPGETCNYHIILNQGQAIYRKSSYVTCSGQDADGYGGTETTHECCTLDYTACYVQPVTLNFIPRLIHRNNSCCFEKCPQARYWREGVNANTPQKALIQQLTSDHVLTNAGNLSLCRPEPITTACSALVACQNSRCTQRPSPPGPAVPNTPGVPSDPGPPSQPDTPSVPVVPSQPPSHPPADAPPT